MVVLVVDSRKVIRGGAALERLAKRCNLIHFFIRGILDDQLVKSPLEDRANGHVVAIRHIAGGDPPGELAKDVGIDEVGDVDSSAVGDPDDSERFKGRHRLADDIPTHAEQPSQVRFRGEAIASLQLVGKNVRFYRFGGAVDEPFPREGPQRSATDNARLRQSRPGKIFD